MKTALKLIHLLFLIFVFFWIQGIFAERAHVDPFTGNYLLDILILGLIELVFWIILGINADSGSGSGSEEHRGQKQREERPPWAN